MNFIQPSFCEASLQLAGFAHEGQKRWNKSAYINHPIAVSLLIPELLQTEFKFKLFFTVDEIEYVKAIAHLHDVAEDVKDFKNNEELVVDTFMSRAGVNKLDPRNGYSIILNALKTLNKNYHKSYLDFVLACRLNPFARIVKYADLTHNSSDLTKGSMLDKYLLAMHILRQ